MSVPLSSNPPEIQIDFVHHHDDFDGVVAAAMLCAWQGRPLATMPVTYTARESWLSTKMQPRTAVVDFLYRDDVALWIDHHDTSFSTEDQKRLFHPDAFHIWDRSALSCPSVIIARPWFSPALRRRFALWTRWADVVDSARYKSPAEAMDLRSPYLRVAASVPLWVHTATASGVVNAIAQGNVRDVLGLPQVSAAAAAIARDRETVRRRAHHRVSPTGRVAYLDQGHLSAAYNRYLPFVLAPSSRYAVAIYAAQPGWVVSVGENPWNRPVVRRNLGELCKQYGGGGRAATAGVPVHALSGARSLAEVLVEELDSPAESAQ